LTAGVTLLILYEHFRARLNVQVFVVVAWQSDQTRWPNSPREWRGYKKMVVGQPTSETRRSLR